jgi:hypothetical protein
MNWVLLPFVSGQPYSVAISEEWRHGKRLAAGSHVLVSITHHYFSNKDPLQPFEERPALPDHEVAI